MRANKVSILGLGALLWAAGCGSGDDLSSVDAARPDGASADGSTAADGSTSADGSASADGSSSLDGSTPPDGGPIGIGQSVSMTVDSSGASIPLGDVVLTIPPGAVSNALTIVTVHAP